MNEYMGPRFATSDGDGFIDLIDDSGSISWLEVDEGGEVYDEDGNDVGYIVDGEIDFYDGDVAYLE